MRVGKGGYAVNRAVWSFRRCEAFFLSPFSEAAICYRHPMLREGGGVVGCGTFAVYSAGRFFFGL